VAFGRAGPLGKRVFGLMIAGAAAPPDPLLGAPLVGLAAGAGRGVAVAGAGFGAGAAPRAGAVGLGAARLLLGAELGFAAAGTAVGEPPISSGGR
jgi:hypothetical protein